MDLDSVNLSIEAWTDLPHPGPALALLQQAEIGACAELLAGFHVDPHPAIAGVHAPFRFDLVYVLC